MNTRGQNLRLSLKDSSASSPVKKYIAGALTFDLQIDADTEDISSKDSTNSWKEYESTLKGWSGSGQCRLAKDAADTAALGGWEISDLVGATLEADFDETTGTQNRVLSQGRKRGNVIITSWKISAQNNGIINADFSFQGTGELANIPTISGNDTVTFTQGSNTATGSYTASDNSVISVQIPTSASWLTASVSGNTITFTSTSQTAETAVVTLTTTTGAYKLVTVNQPAYSVSQ